MEPPLTLEGANYRYDPKDDPPDDCFRAGGDTVARDDRGQEATPDREHGRRHGKRDGEHKIPPRAHCYLADPEYGRRFAEAACLDLDKVLELSRLDNNGLIQATLSASM
jgi:catalase